MALVSTGTNFQVLGDAEKFCLVERLPASQEGLFSVEILEVQKCGSR